MKSRTITAANALLQPFTFCQGCPPGAVQIVFPISPEAGRPLDVMPAPWVHKTVARALDSARWWAETRGIASVSRCGGCGHVLAIVQTVA